MNKDDLETLVERLDELYALSPNERDQLTLDKAALEEAIKRVVDKQTRKEFAKVIAYIDGLLSRRPLRDVLAGPGDTPHNGEDDEHDERDN